MLPEQASSRARGGPAGQPIAEGQRHEASETRGLVYFSLRLLMGLSGLGVIRWLSRTLYSQLRSRAAQILSGS